MLEPRKLRVFLCHASQDKPVVRELYQKLLAEGWIDPWLDKEKLLPGQEWELEIEKSMESADAVVVCLSKSSVEKEGYYQKEIKKVLDVSDQKPEGAIFIIPLRLDDCQPPRRLAKWQYVDYFPLNQREPSYQRLLQSLKMRNVKSLPEAKKVSVQLVSQNPVHRGHFDQKVACLSVFMPEIAQMRALIASKRAFLSRSWRFFIPN